jgi:hypothetical protein
MVCQSSCTVVANGIIGLSAPVLSEYEQRIRVLETYVQLLIVRTSLGDYWPDGLHDVRKLLTALPLRMNQFSTMSRHLHNAADYCRQKEFGAASFELRTLRGHLQRL